MVRKMKFLAYYLPQYHPIPENDLWWGKGFTEWTNVAKARPLFRGHTQPKLPSDLGFYDLRVPEVQITQAELAKEFGVDGFIYYQYWFGDGKMLLEKPAEEMLKNKKVDIPFCFCWANETWKGVWHGLQNAKTLIEQVYDGVKGYEAYFKYLLPFFKDSRYIKVDNKPMFHIYRIEDIPDSEIFLNIFNQLALREGFNGMYFVTTLTTDVNLILENENIYGYVGLDIFRKMRYNQNTIFKENSILNRIEMKFKKWVGHTNKVEERTKPLIFDYSKGVSQMNASIPDNKYIPCVFPNWDNSPRSGNKSMIFKNSDPKAWEEHLRRTVNVFLEEEKNPPFVIIKSWNEWAEGNYLEPDTQFGTEWLESLKKVKEELIKTT